MLWQSSLTSNNKETNIMSMYLHKGFVMERLGRGHWIAYRYDVPTHCPSKQAAIATINAWVIEGK